MASQIYAYDWTISLDGALLKAITGKSVYKPCARLARLTVSRLVSLAVEWNCRCESDGLRLDDNRFVGESNFIRVTLTMRWDLCILWSRETLARLTIELAASRKRRNNQFCNSSSSARLLLVFVWIVPSLCAQDWTASASHQQPDRRFTSDLSS